MLLRLTAFVCLIGISMAAAVSEAEKNEVFWKNQRENDLLNSINKFSNINTAQKAKNVIIFIGDGMSIGTSTAGRVYMGQKKNETGEEYVTTLDSFPHTGTAKTYSVNQQTPDSAATATAILTGVKTTNGALGMVASHDNKCTQSKHVESALEKAVKMGKSTGVVTTTRIQHATPASAYAHIPKRSWFSRVDAGSGCKDIAQQLFDKREDIQVLLGGGRVHMHSSSWWDNVKDETGKIETGKRAPGVNANFIKRWKNSFPNHNNVYVNNKQELTAVHTNTTDYLLGLFASNEMEYRLNNSIKMRSQPSLPEMVEKAVKILKKNDEGFFLLVEAGMIDKAHHKTLVKYALEEFSDFDRAIKVAKDLTSDDDTLIIATADHGHVFTYGSAGKRGTTFSEVLINQEETEFGRFSTNTAYGNGPNYNHKSVWSSKNTAIADAARDEYRPLTALERRAETHGAEDVLVYASGPRSHLITGVHEQTYIAQVVFFASCMDPQYSNYPHCSTPTTPLMTEI